MNSLKASTLEDCINGFAAGSSVVSGFDNVAQDYEKVRPDYPVEVIGTFIENLSLQDTSVICDLACGTGKLTKALCDRRFYNLTAIDPAADMVAKCKSLVPSAKVVQGVAESIPAETHAFDAVVIGTAFHWFDGSAALNEIARVLKVQGRVGLIWNMLNPEIEWVSKIRSLLETDDQPNRNHDTVNWKKAFEQDTRFSFLSHETKRYTIKATPKAVVDCILSFKAAGNMTVAQIEKIKTDAFKVLAQDLRTANKEVIEVPYRVEMYWTSKAKEATRSTTELHNNLLAFTRLPVFASESSIHQSAVTAGVVQSQPPVSLDMEVGKARSKRTCSPAARSSNGANDSLIQ